MGKSNKVPMVGDSDDRLLAFVADEFDLIFHLQNSLVAFLACSVPDLALHGPRIPFFSIFTQICKLHPLFPGPIDRYRSVEVFLAPSFRTAM